jgi:hypothetical protein
LLESLAARRVEMEPDQPLGLSRRRQRRAQSGLVEQHYAPLANPAKTVIEPAPVTFPAKAR